MLKYCDSSKIKFIEQQKTYMVGEIHLDKAVTAKGSRSHSHLLQSNQGCIPEPPGRGGPARCIIHDRRGVWGVMELERSASPHSGCTALRPPAPWTKEKGRSVTDRETGSFWRSLLIASFPSARTPSERGRGWAWGGRRRPLPWLVEVQLAVAAAVIVAAAAGSSWRK